MKGELLLEKPIYIVYMDYKGLPQSANPNILTCWMVTSMLFLFSSYWKIGMCPTMRSNDLKRRGSRNAIQTFKLFFTLPNLPESLRLVMDRPPKPSCWWVVQLWKQCHIFVLVGVGCKLHCDWLGRAWGLVTVEVWNGLFGFWPFVKPDKCNPSGQTWKRKPTEMQNKQSLPFLPNLHNLETVVQLTHLRNMGEKRKQASWETIHSTLT